jgi:hypothetical protein
MQFMIFINIFYLKKKEYKYKIFEFLSFYRELLKLKKLLLNLLKINL